MLLGTWQPDKIAGRLHFLRLRAVGAPRAAVILRDAACVGRIVRRIIRRLATHGEQYCRATKEQPAANLACNQCHGTPPELEFAEEKGNVAAESRKYRPASPEGTFYNREVLAGQELMALD